MKLTPYLTELLNEVADVITRCPQRYEQCNPQTACGGAPACLVGWLVTLHLRRRHERVRGVVDIRWRAAGLLASELGLDSAGAFALVDSLYHARHWPTNFQRRWQDAWQHRAASAKVAAARVHHFIKTLT